MTIKKNKTMNTMIVRMIIEDHLLNQKEEKKILMKILKIYSHLKTKTKIEKIEIKIDFFFKFICMNLQNKN